VPSDEIYQTPFRDRYKALVIANEPPKKIRKRKNI